MVLKTRDTDIGSMRNVPKDLVCVFVSHYNHHMIVKFILSIFLKAKQASKQPTAFFGKFRHVFPSFCNEENV